MTSSDIKESLEWLNVLHDGVKKESAQRSLASIKTAQYIAPILQAVYLGNIAYQLALMNEREKREWEKMDVI